MIPGIDAADPGTVDNETEKTAENRTDAEKSTETEESQTDNSTDSRIVEKSFQQLRMESTRSL